jgi:hypothetical protein
MRTLLVLVILVALGALGLWFFLGSEKPMQEAGGEVASLEKPSTSNTEAIALDKQASDSARETNSRVASSAPRATSIAPAANDEHLAEVKGRCVFANGSPAAGVSIELHGWQANEERVIRHGMPDHWDDLSTTTAADGRFSIRFDPPLAFQFVVNAAVPGYAKASWRWSEIKPDEHKDLGDVELIRGGTIIGHIVDAKGTVLKSGWTAHADSGMNATGDGGRDATRKSAELDPTTGEFKLEDMPPGSTRLQAYSRIANWIAGPTVEVRAGETIDATIRYEGPDNSARIVVILFTQPFFVYSHDVGEIVLRAPGIEPRHAAKIAQSSQSFSFDNLPPGRYTIEINDPKFLPWTKDASPGTSVDAHLKGNASVRLEVVDASTKQPVAPSKIRVRFENVNFRPNEFLILERGKKPPSSGVYDGLIPVDQTLIVSADGYADCELPVLEFKANEKRSLRAEMTRGNRIAGRVVMIGARSPAADAEVELADPTGVLTIARSDSDLSRGNVVRTDASGRFEFTMVPAGKHAVRASFGAFATASAEVDVREGADKLDLVLEVPACAFLTGRLIAPDGASFEGLSLLVSPAANESAAARQAIEWTAREKAAVPISADGSFRAGPCPVGEAIVALSLPVVTVQLSFHSSTGRMPDAIELARVQLDAGKDMQHDFDVRAIFPGRIEVDLRVNGSPAPGVVIEARKVGGVGNVDGVAIGAAIGTTRTNAMACGDYRLLARSIDSAWFFVAPQTVTVKAGETASTSIDVPLVEGVVQMLDDNKMPARVARKVAIRRESDDALRPIMNALLSTDSDGHLQLKLPPGSYRLFAGDGFINRDTPSASFEMTSSGPVPASLEFPR